MPTRIAGTRNDLQTKFVKSTVDQSLKEGEKVTQDSVKGILPIFLGALSKILGFFGIPEGISSFLSGKVVHVCEPISNQAINKTCKVCKKSLTKSANSSIDSSVSFFGRLFSRFTR